MLTAETPLSHSEFAARMARLGPFEPEPFIAVGVSGGADSLALALHAHHWAAERGGRIVALTVDHGLRPEAEAEAREVASWLAPRGIAHEILTWRPAMPPRNRQAAAREARYDLLATWCRRGGCLHLLTAHHREDQAETLLLRLARGSGLDGLAGIPAIRELSDCRVLRPLLDIPSERLRAFLRAEGQVWVEDPSNQDPRYARIRLRRAGAMLAAEGLDAERLATTAGHLARARAAIETMVAAALAESVTLHPGGFALLERSLLSRFPREVALRCLAQLVVTIGGGLHTPRFERLEGLFEALATQPGAARTLAGCRVLDWRGKILFCREAAAMAGDVALEGGETLIWDHRFAARLTPGAPSGLRLGALGSDAAALRAVIPDAFALLPALVPRSLPAVRDLVGIIAVPHLGYVREGSAGAMATIRGVWFRPRRPLTSAAFTVV